MNMPATGQIEIEEKISQELEEQVKKLTEIVSTIQRFSKLTATLEQLVFSEDTDNQLVERAIALVSSFDEKYDSLSSDKLEIRVEAVENKIQDDVRHFVELIRAHASPKTPDETRILPERHVAEFSKRVQKAFAFRVLLCERGENLPPFKLETPVADLQASINMLKLQAKIHKDQLVTELKDCLTQIQFYLAEKTLSSEFSEMISNLMQGLMANVEHLERGLEIASLPVQLTVMVAEIRAANQQNKSAANKPTGAENPDGEPTEKSEEEPQDQESDYFNRVRRWLESPLGVSWKQVSKESSQAKPKK